MPWEKSFNIDSAIDSATQLFWEKGYHSTSLADLIKATGVNKGSFYNAFGSKKNLFTSSLTRYEKEQRAGVVEQLESLNDPRAAIEKFFDMLIQQSLQDDNKKGCFLVNTALELSSHDDDIQQLVKTGLNGTESFFESQLQQGIEQGIFAKTLQPAQDAKGLLGMVVAIRVLARGVFDQASLEAIKAQAMRLIDLPA